MLQDTETALENKARFVARVRESGIVWGLRGPDGWATAGSTDYEDTTVMPFWSDRAYAARAAREEWQRMEPTSIPLSTFIDSLLRGMHDDGILVGPNWDAQGCGLELEPLALARELVGHPNGCAR